MDHSWVALNQAWPQKGRPVLRGSWLAVSPTPTTMLNARQGLAWRQRPAGPGGGCCRGASPGTGRAQRSTYEAAANVVERCEVTVADRQRAAFARARLDLDLETQHIAKIPFEGARVGVLIGPAPRPGRRAVAVLGLGLHQSLHGAHVQILGHDALRQGFGILAADQSPRVAGR